MLQYSRNEKHYVINVDSKGREKFLDVDPSMSQEFNINEHGFIRNDISAAMMATSQSEFDAKISNLQAISEDVHNMSDDELFDAILPRYSQSPNDFIRYTEYLAEKYAPKSDEKVESSEESVTPKTD